MMSSKKNTVSHNHLSVADSTAIDFSYSSESGVSQLASENSEIKAGSRNSNDTSINIHSVSGCDGFQLLLNPETTHYNKDKVEVSPTPITGNLLGDGVVGTVEQRHDYSVQSLLDVVNKTVVDVLRVDS